MTERLAVLGRILLVLLALAGGLAALSAPRVRSPEPVEMGQPAPVDLDTTDSSWGAVSLMGQNPFRMGRRPASPRYLPFSEDDEREMEASAPPMPRPAWALTGVLWGPQPLAVFEGIPGELSSGILAEGDTVGPIHVERIAADTVYLRGTGASWTFTLEVPWKKGGTT